MKNSKMNMIDTPHPEVSTTGSLRIRVFFELLYDNKKIHHKIPIWLQTPCVKFLATCRRLIKQHDSDGVSITTLPFQAKVSSLMSTIHDILKNRKGKVIFHLKYMGWSSQNKKSDWSVFQAHQFFFRCENELLVIC